MTKALPAETMLFEFIAYLSGLAVLALVVFAWVMYRDSFHALIYIGPMLAFLYSFAWWYAGSFGEGKAPDHRRLATSGAPR